MSEFYVDTRIMEVVHKDDLDLNRLAPELYYEYICGTMEGVIKETWSCGENKYIDFATTTNNPYKERERQMHFKRHNASPLYLTAYTVPPSWYKEETEKAMSNRNIKEEEGNE